MVRMGLSLSLRLTITALRHVILVNKLKLCLLSTPRQTSYSYLFRFILPSPIFYSVNFFSGGVFTPDESDIAFTVDNYGIIHYSDQAEANFTWKWV